MSIEAGEAICEVCRHVFGFCTHITGHSIVRDRKGPGTGRQITLPGLRILSGSRDFFRVLINLISPLLRYLGKSCRFTMPMPCSALMLPAHLQQKRVDRFGHFLVPFESGGQRHVVMQIPIANVSKCDLAGPPESAPRAGRRRVSEILRNAISARRYHVSAPRPRRAQDSDMECLRCHIPAASAAFFAITTSMTKLGFHCSH